MCRFQTQFNYFSHIKIQVILLVKVGLFVFIIEYHMQLISLLSECPYLSNNENGGITSEALLKWRTVDFDSCFNQQNCNEAYKKAKESKSDIVDLLQIVSGEFPSSTWSVFLYRMINRDRELILRILFKEDRIDYDSMMSLFEKEDHPFYLCCKNAFYVDVDSFHYLQLLSDVIDTGLSYLVLILLEVMILTDKVRYVCDVDHSYNFINPQRIGFYIPFLLISYRIVFPMV